MLQPFLKFESVHLKQLIALGNVFVVSQTYDRADHFMDQGKACLLLTDYTDMGPAELHRKAIRADKYAAIIDLRKRAHLQKLENMMLGTEYIIYWSVIKSSTHLKKRLDASYKHKIRRFLIEKTSWRVIKDEEVKTQFVVTFGELFLILKWRTQRLRIKFAEIEKY